jgi:YVTN family beta-propeller protein
MKKTLIWGLVLLLSPLMASAAPLMYVPAGNANELVVIDLESDRVVDRIGELENAHGLAANAHTEYLVAGSMQPVEVGEQRKMAKPDVVSDEDHAAHHGKGGGGMASPSYLSIIHPVHGHVMRRIPVPALTHHIAISPDGEYAIAVHSGAGSFSVVDLKRMAVIKTVQTGRRPNYAVFNPKGDRLYISNAGDGSISEIDGANWKKLRDIMVGGEPEHVVMAKDGAELYIADVSSAAVTVADLPAGKLGKRFEVGKEPHGIDVSADGRWLFVSSKGANRVSRIDLEKDEVSSASLGPAPYHLEYVDEVGKLYVSSRQSPLIWVLDPGTLKVIKKIGIEKGVAHQMVVVTWR